MARVSEFLGEHVHQQMQILASSILIMYNGIIFLEISHEPDVELTPHSKFGIVTAVVYVYFFMQLSSLPLSTTLSILLHLVLVASGKI